MAIYPRQVVVGEDLEVLHLLASLLVVGLAQDHHLLLVGGDLGKAGLHRFEGDENLLVEASSAAVRRRPDVLLELVEAGEALLATRREQGGADVGSWSVSGRELVAGRSYPRRRKSLVARAVVYPTSAPWTTKRVGLRIVVVAPTHQSRFALCRRSKVSGGALTRWRVDSGPGRHGTLVCVPSILDEGAICAL